MGKIGYDYIFFLKWAVEEESDKLSFSEGEMWEKKLVY